MSYDVYIDTGFASPKDVKVYASAVQILDTSGVTAGPLILPLPPPVRLRDTVHIRSAAYALVVAEVAAATWTATAVATVAVTAESHHSPAVARCRVQVTATSQVRQTIPVALTTARSASPWDSVLAADDELLLLLN